jgi:hypothetical protein
MLQALQPGCNVSDAIAAGQMMKKSWLEWDTA